MKIWTHLRKSRRTEIVGGFRLCTIVLSHSVSMEPPDDDHRYCLPENDLSSQKCEKIAGEKEKSVWLIMNDKYILHKLKHSKTEAQCGSASSDGLSHARLNVRPPKLVIYYGAILSR